MQGQPLDARERALYLLYEAHSKGIAPAATIDIQVLEPDELTQELVRGVDANLPQLDELIAAKAKGWTLTRMPVLDLSVMRLAVFELIEAGFAWVYGPHRWAGGTVVSTHGLSVGMSTLLLPYITSWRR